MLAVENACGLAKEEFFGPEKSAALISEIAGISSSAVSRRYDAGRKKMRENREMSMLVTEIEDQHWQRSN
jgi:hypothetical protein